MLQAVRTGLNAKASGDTGRVMVVLLTDGRANISLAKSNEDPEALAEGAPKPSKVTHVMPPLLCMPLHTGVRCGQVHLKNHQLGIVWLLMTIAKLNALQADDCNFWQRVQHFL